MSTEEVVAQEFAKLLIRYRESLTSPHESTASLQAAEWNELPPGERELMLAAARITLTEVEQSTAEDVRRRYFAKPGEAEWGC